jgi:hypothetical protein
MNRILAFTLSALMLSAPALAQTASEQRQIYKDKPNGQGDPHGISCYRPPSSFSRVTKLECRYNAEWAQITATDNHSGPVDIGNRAGGAPVNVINGR